MLSRPVAEILGCGTGKRLLMQAPEFCDELGFGKPRLCAVKGLDAAGKLYQGQGFELAEE